MPLEQKSYASNSRFETAGDTNGQIAKRDAEMSLCPRPSKVLLSSQWVLGVINNLNPN